MVVKKCIKDISDKELIKEWSVYDTMINDLKSYSPRDRMWLEAIEEELESRDYYQVISWEKKDDGGRCQ